MNEHEPKAIAEPELPGQEQQPTFRPQRSQEYDGETYSHLDDRKHYRHSTCPWSERGLTYKN